MGIAMTRFCTYEHPDSGELEAMTEEEFSAGGRELIEEAGEFVWHYAPDAETALARHYHKFAHWEADLNEGREELHTY